jgi:hypothetical protein
MKKHRACCARKPARRLLELEPLDRREAPTSLLVGPGSVVGAAAAAVAIANHAAHASGGGAAASTGSSHQVAHEFSGSTATHEAKGAS